MVELLRKYLTNFIIVVFIGSIFSYCGGNEPDTERLKPIKRLSKIEKKLYRNRNWVDLLNYYEKNTIENNDLQRKLIYAEAGFWTNYNLLTTVEIGAQLVDDQLDLNDQESLETSSYEFFMRGQNRFILDDPETAKKYFQKYLLTTDISNEIKALTNFYLKVISERKTFDRLFIEGEEDLNLLTQLLSKEQTGSKDPFFNALLGKEVSLQFFYNYTFPPTMRSSFACDSVEICSLKTYNFIPHQLFRAGLLRKLHALAPIQYTGDKDILYTRYRLVASLNDHELMGQFNAGQQTLLKDILSQNGQSDDKLRLFFEYALSYTPKQKISDWLEKYPLSAINALNHSMGIPNANASSDLYRKIFPYLINEDYSADYRNHLHLALWKFLADRGSSYVDSLRDRRGFTPELRSVEMAAILLPYRAHHNQDDRLGLNDLKILQRNNHYLRPLIPSYELLTVETASVGQSENAVNN